MKKQFTPDQKADVAIAAIKGIQTTGQIASALRFTRPKSVYGRNKRCKA